MEAREAYEVIRDAVEANPRRRIVDSFFDDQNFGSFIISFEEDAEARSIVNDRGFVWVAEGFDGSGASRATVPSLNDADGSSLVEGLNL
jgi:hypothetical protein